MVEIKISGPKKGKKPPKSWKWLKIGLPLMFLLGFVGWMRGWLREDAGYERARVDAPMQKQVKTLARRSPYGKKLVALTFDDGPGAEITDQLLAILREKEVVATFFMLGKMAQRYPEVVKRVKAEGHEIGSHTMNHANLNRLRADSVAIEVEQAKDVFQSVLGETPRLTRPPYGIVNSAVREKAGAPLILWRVDPEDWRYQDAEVVKGRTVSYAFDGAIILLHDVYATSVTAAGLIIDELRAQGYEFVTVSELARFKGVEMQKGGVYGAF